MNRKMSWLGLVFAVLLLPACAWEDPSTRSDQSQQSKEDLALRQKFRGVSSVELRIDSIWDEWDREKNPPAIVYSVDGPVNRYMFNGTDGEFSRENIGIYTYVGKNGLSVPKYLRLVRYPVNAKFLGYQKEKVNAYEGDPILDVTVPVAERIPDDLLDDLRKNGGTFRLKLRLLSITILVGWDIERRIGQDPKDPIKNGNIPPTYFHTGGDFKEERRKCNGDDIPMWRTCIWEKGWYSDPDTNQRIESVY